jgi:mRNA interferase RelE/StbE
MFQIHLSRDAKKFLEKSPQKERIKEKLLLLAKEPANKLLDIKKLKGMPGYYRLRVGGIRIIYFIKPLEKIIQVLDIDNRGDVYK